MRVENCRLHFSKRLSTEKADDAVISFKYLLNLPFLTDIQVFTFTFELYI